MTMHLSSCKEVGSPTPPHERTWGGIEGEREVMAPFEEGRREEERISSSPLSAHMHVGREGRMEEERERRGDRGAPLPAPLLMTKFFSIARERESLSLSSLFFFSSFLYFILFTFYLFIPFIK